jgi:ABC-2 type transport system permease protein
MRAVVTIAHKEIRAAFRNRMFVTIMALFLTLSALSVYIGSTTKCAEMRLYDETVTTLSSQGVTALPPVPEIHTLTILGNLTEYVVIVGAILAVVLGYNTLTDEKESGGLPLILSRPVYRDALLSGKLLGNMSIIAALLMGAFVFSLVLLVIVGGLLPTVGDVVRLLTVVVLAFFYMLIFFTFSMLLSIHMWNSASVFLVSLVLWMAVGFVIPEMAQTQMANSTVVNSVSGAANEIPQDTAVSRTIDFFSPAWHLRTIGGELLEVAPGSADLSTYAVAADSLRTLLALLAPCVALGAVAYATFLRSESLTLE